MKIAFNETQTTVVLAGGRLELHPKGLPGSKDRRQIADSVAELPDVKRFALLGKISILTLEEAAKRDADALKQVAEAKAAVATKAAKDASEAKIAAEAAAVAPSAPPTEVTPEESAPAAEEPKEKLEAKPSEDSSEHGRSRRRSRH